VTNPLKSDDRIKHASAPSQKHPATCLIQCHTPLTENIHVL